MLQELGFSPYQGIRYSPDMAPVMFLASLPPYESLNLDNLQNLGKARIQLDADMAKLNDDMRKLNNDMAAPIKTDAPKS